MQCHVPSNKIVEPLEIHLFRSPYSSCINDKNLLEMVTPSKGKDCLFRK